MNLGQRIFLYFGSLIMVIVFSFFVINYFIVQQSLLQRARNDLRHLLESTDIAVEHFLDTAVRNYLRSLVDQNIIVLTELDRKVTAGLMTRQAAKEAFQRHVIDQKIGESGYIVALRSEGPKIFIDIHPYARGTDCAFNQGCQDWIRFQNGYNEYEWQNPADAHIRKKVGYFRAFKPWNWVVGATSYKDEFTQLVKIEDVRAYLGSLTILDKGYFTLLDENMKFLVHPELQGVYAGQMKDIDSRSVVQGIVGNLDRFHYYRWKNPSNQSYMEKFAFATKLEDFNWYLAGTGYMDDVTRPIQRMVHLSYGLIVIVAAVLILLTIIFSRSLSRPLGELIRGLEQFHQNRKVFTMQSGSVAEVDAVGRAVEKMTRVLEASERENRRMYDKMVQSSKMEAVGTLAGGIAHDFNNILAAVLGYTELAKKNQTAPTKTGVYLDKAITGIGKATDLIQQILVFSRQSDQSKRVIRMADVVEDSLVLIRASIPTTIAIDTALDSSANVLADTTQIQQVMMNLCTNAYHAMARSGGTIAVSLKDEAAQKEASGENTEMDPGGYVVLEVSDTGPGIDPAIKTKILDPYFTTKSVGKGTGLGLSIVAEIIRAHKGRLEISSIPRKGATFRIYLPKTEELPSPECPASFTEINSGGGERIILVDDEKDILNTMEAFLEQKGYRVTAFTRGDEAFTAFREQGADLVITDMTMPGMTGLDLARKIFEAAPGQKVIMCSGYNEFMNTTSALEAGLADYLKKPVSMAALSKSIRQALDGSG